MSSEANLRIDFESAMGEEFGGLVCPPVPFQEASPHECCEAIWLALGDDVTPTTLAKISGSELEQLAAGFARWFECSPPPTIQIAEAIARTLTRWPPGSLGETA